MASYYADLEGLSAGELHRETKRRMVVSSQHSVRLIASLAEVSRRRVFLSMGQELRRNKCIT